MHSSLGHFLFTRIRWPFVILKTQKKLWIVVIHIRSVRLVLQDSVVLMKTSVMDKFNERVSQLDYLMGIETYHV